MSFLPIIKKIDLYGKEPDFYYKNNLNKTTWIGRIFTLLYLGVYIAFFIYKIVRMAKRKDVTFYDTNSNGEEIPSIHLNKEIFNAALAFDDINSSLPYMNERIYTISGKYIVQTKENEKWNTSEEDIIFRQCEVSDFGSNYQNIMAKKNISQMFCPEKVDLVLEGYYTMEKYSYIKVNFKRCVNTTENNNSCLPNNIIEQYLTVTRIDTKLQDIELVPQDYENPVRYLEREIVGTSLRGLYPQITVEMQIVIIETDNNIIGFEGLANVKKDKYLKYDTKIINAIPIGSLISTVDSSNNLNEIIIQLSSNILYQKRTYTQLIDVLGDVGGLMEIINMIFSVICSLVVNFLYNKSMVNNLFNFDLNKKLILLKNKNNNKINDIDINNKILQKNIYEKNENFQIKKKFGNLNGKTKLYFNNNNKSCIDRTNKSSRRSFNDLYENNRRNSYINHASTILEENNDKKSAKEVAYNNYQLNRVNNILENKTNIIKKIRTYKLCVDICFCCIKHNENINNILFDEGMKLIMENLDIFNVFKRLYELLKLELLLSEDDIKAQMSDECKQKLFKMINKNYQI